ncbi:DUF6503 family protein [Flagellimonas allohymeniacidonis]|uniref:Threonine synthase n=1 Tax=Flagellimonas allohymeniacidonis TaxID=2517819 RepID=A0A4Q8QM02_9FLAO|nr:DUF6503 family protein [Allomuricauda hymeniacidonis]TAI49326.1 hypothetical protein EW142_05885 [Allomuricauda hymeniacidonis]
MKQLSTLLILLTLAACKQTPKEDSKNEQQDSSAIVEEKYPQSLSNTFKAHGGLELWRDQRTLSFSMERPDFTEVHTIDLHTRKDRVDTEKFILGFDGQQVWLQDEGEKYKGNPGFYHNLMFYFYAMPFVLADDGIVYGHTEDLVFEGKHYPGVRIAYHDGVGASSKDEYYIHYDPITNQMVWLGYTVTYKSGEKSDNIRWIRYSDWIEVEGLLLPKSISWYTYESRTPLEPRNTVTFNDIKLSTTKKSDSFYAKPESAAYVELKKS